VLTNNSWRFILEEASHYIQSNWKENITPTYLSMANRFPLNPEAKEDIELPQFTDFFKPKGTLSGFYQNLLKPFVNETMKEWDWRSIDSLQLPLSKAILQQMQYAFQLQHVFFPNNDDKLLIPFILQLVNMDKETRAVSFNLNGQLVTFQKSESHTPRGLTWPGNTTFHNTSVNFVGKNNLPINETIQGDWALFHLIKQANPILSPHKELLLTLTMDNHTAKYKILTQDYIINPFLLSTLGKLQLPEELG
jgi:type VI secretion system protein ImpL